MSGVLSAVLVLVALCYFYLNRGLSREIFPADLTCLQADQGHFIPNIVPTVSIYGIGLSHARHINETASEFDPAIAPPVFKKSTDSLVKGGGNVAIPSASALMESLTNIETDIHGKLNEKGIIGLRPLLDYEVELGLVLLEDVSAEDIANPDFNPKIGFILANDLSARSVAILGEGRENRYEYWGASKSFPGFTPINQRIWVPETKILDAIPCVTLNTQVNGELRQNEVTSNLIYTPSEMLGFIRSAYPLEDLKKGDIILTGTPGGVTLNVPRWKSRLAQLVGLDRFQKLEISQKESSAKAFLKPGDTVRVSAEWLGDVSTTVTE